MTDKKIAVRVENEKQWNEVRNVYGTDFSPEFRDTHRYVSAPKDQLVIYDNGAWVDVDGFNEEPDGYELLEFKEWQEHVKGDNMREIKVISWIPLRGFDFMDIESNIYDGRLI